MDLGWLETWRAGQIPSQQAQLRLLLDCHLLTENRLARPVSWKVVALFFVGSQQRRVVCLPCLYPNLRRSFVTGYVNMFSQVTGDIRWHERGDTAPWAARVDPIGIRRMCLSLPIHGELTWR